MLCATNRRRFDGSGGRGVTAIHKKAPALYDGVAPAVAENKALLLRMPAPTQVTAPDGSSAGEHSRRIEREQVRRGLTLRENDRTSSLTGIVLRNG